MQIFSGRRCRLFLSLLILIFLGSPAVALAHPLGNFTINRYSRLKAGLETIQIIYIVDMAEIPTFQTWPEIDTDDDGDISPAEEATYLTRQTSVFKDNLSLIVNDASQNLTLRERSLKVSPGQGGLNTLRLEARFTAALPLEQTIWQVEYYDANYAERLGWQEVVVNPTAEVTLIESTAPTQDLSRALTDYPQDLLQSPPAVNQATFRFKAGASPVGPSEGVPVTTPSTISTELPFGLGQDKFAELITIPTLGPFALFLALLAAFGWGAAHALTPGHGKTIVAAYLVGSRGTVRHAVFLGLTTTLTHTAGVFALGLLTLFASQFILSERLYPWLGVASGLLVVGIGLSLFRGRLAGLFISEVPRHHHHDHEHHHDHQHEHHHDHEHTHSHVPDGPITWRSLLALGISGGLIPCPSALVVMLSAIALQRIGFGLLLVITFSLGLAGVLTIIGVLWVQATQLLERLSQRTTWFERLPGRGRWLQVLPAASALFITLIGLGITVQSLIQTGWLTL